MDPTIKKENIKSLLILNSKNDFIDQYKKLCDKDIIKAKPLHFALLIAMKEAIEKDSLLKFKRTFDLINYASESESHADLTSFYEDDGYPLKDTNILIFACQHNRTHIVKQILSNFSNMSNILLLNLNKILPEDCDNFGHTAFYYAIAYSNQEILKILIDMWPDKYFATNSYELEKILSRTYEEIKVRNVNLLKEMEIFIEDKIMDHRFISKDSTEDKDLTEFQISLETIKERINMLHDSISSLHSCDKANDKFIFTARFAAHNIFILKQQLKCTYSKLPWEEIEFCLVSYILTHIKKSELNLFYKVTLSRSKILNYLSIFKTKLEKFANEDLKKLDINTLNKLPKINRNENVIKVFIVENPEFQELRKDYYNLRNVLSLETINNYAKLITSADFNDKLGLPIILRCVTAIGEYLKDTLESPKLSSTLSETILLSLPKKTRNVYITLRNSQSYAHSLSRKLETEISNIDYFTRIKNDTRKIITITTYLLYNMKIRIIKNILEKFVASEDIYMLRGISIFFKEIKFKDLKPENFNLITYKTIKKIVEELKRNIVERSAQQESILTEIDKKIASEEKNFIKLAEDLSTTPLILGELYLSFCEGNTDNSDVKLAKYYAKKILNNLNISTKLFEFLKIIADLAVDLLRSCLSKMSCENLDEIDRLTCLLVNLASNEIETNEWSHKMKEKMNKTSLIIEEKEEPYTVTTYDHTAELSLKISQLESFFKAIESVKINMEKSDEVILKAMEIMILDILSIINSTSHNNIFWIDEYSPILFGRCLLNHLAYNNTIIDVLLLDPTVSLFINTKKIIAEKCILTEKKIYEIAKEDIAALKERYNRGFSILSEQEKMFNALQEGNDDLFKNCLAQGADVNGRKIGLQTSLHVAAKTCNFEMVKFLLNECSNINYENINKQSPLHIAAACCRASIVELFVQDEDKRIPIDGKDNEGKTALHYAAKACDIETINILLKHKANAQLKDEEGFTPLHYAITSNNLKAFEALVYEDKDIETKVTIMGFTPLHLAATKGCVDIMNILFKLKANVNARTKKNCTPLHLAAVKGNVEAVKILISQGADIDAKDSSGGVSLLYAADQVHVETVKVLLAAGAKVNLQNNDGNTALQFAVRAGASEIVDVMLEFKADILLADVLGNNAIHYAIQNGQLKILKAFVKKNPQILLIHENLLIKALEHNKKEIAEYLIKKGVCVNSRGNECHAPLHWAAANPCHREILELLLKHKADINARDYKGATPLHSAVDTNELEAVKFLIAKKADVNAKSFGFATPLHVAAMRGRVDIVNALIESGADVNISASNTTTPLHWAAEEGHADVIAVLLKKVKNIDARDHVGRTALFVAVEKQRERALEILIAKDADLNAINKYKCSPLGYAVANNYKNITKILIGSGADVNVQKGQPLHWAVLFGNRGLVEILLQSRARIDFAYEEKGLSLLHIAVMKNFLDIAEMLMYKGLDVNCGDGDGNTPLHSALEVGNERAVSMLLGRGANVNALNDYAMAPLHLATAESNRAILIAMLNAAPNFDSRNYANSTPLEHAVIMGRVETARILMSYMRCEKENCVNQPSNYRGQRLLHLAAQTGNLDMVRLLEENGADIYAEDSDRHLAVHLAATKKSKDLVEHFLEAGISVDEVGPRGRTPLHFAAMAGQQEVAEFLLSKGARLDSKDWSGVSPIHQAALYGHGDLAQLLAHKGAQHELIDNFGCRLADKCANKLLRIKLRETETLFEMTKQNNAEAVKKHVEGGAIVNARDEGELTPLILAVTMGNEAVVAVLMTLKADPNIPDGRGLTPLHHAAKLSYPKIAKILLANGAIYNPVCKAGRTPLVLAKNKSIATLLKTIDNCFIGVRNDNSKFFIELRKIKNFDTIQAIVGAVNREMNTLITYAWKIKFKKLDQLNDIWDDPVSNTLLVKAEYLFSEGSYSEAMNLYMKAFVMRKDMVGHRHPRTVEIQYWLGVCLHKLGKFHDAAKVLKEAHQYQKGIIPPGSKVAMQSKNWLAMALLKQDKVEEAREAIKEILELPENNFCENEMLISKYCMALVLEKERKYDEAIDVLSKVLEAQKETLGSMDLDTLTTQGKYNELIIRRSKLVEELKRQKLHYQNNKESLGLLHDDTNEASDALFRLLLKEKRYDEAMELLEERYESERESLGDVNKKTLLTKTNMALIHVSRAQFHEALKIYRECREALARAKGRGHPGLYQYDLYIENVVKKIRNSGSSDYVGKRYLVNAKKAILNNDAEAVKKLLDQNSEVNSRDSEGRTLLHYAADAGFPNIVRILLDNGAFVHLVSDKGNTPLHIATLNGYVDVAEVLMDHTKNQASKMNDLVNARTKIRGTTALYVAAKSGQYKMVKSLLKHSAIYNLMNDDLETPVSVATEAKVVKLLRLVESAFQDAKNGDEKIIAALEAAEPDEIEAIFNAHNREDKTVIQVAIMNKHSELASKLLKMIQKPT